MRLGLRIVLVVAAGATAGVVAHLLDGGPSGRAEARSPLWVVRRPVPIGRALVPDDVVLGAWPVDSLPPGAVGADAKPFGRTTRVALLPGEPLLDARLLAVGASAEPGILPVPAGHRAVTVAVDEVVGVAGFVVPGSRVDVVATMDLDGMPTSRVILENLVVLAVAQRTSGEASEEPRVVPSATLAVRPDEATRLILASDRGHIRLAMRAPGEDAGQGPRPVTWTARRLLALPSSTGRPPVRFGAPKARPKPVRSPSPQPTAEPPVPVHRGPQTDWMRPE